MRGTRAQSLDPNTLDHWVIQVKKSGHRGSSVSHIMKTQWLHLMPQTHVEIEDKIKGYAALQAID